MNIRIIFLLSAAFFLPFAYAENNPAPAAAQVAVVPQRGTLYRIFHQGHAAYLFGTVHVGQPGFFPLSSEVTQALARATTLALELDIRQNEPFQEALQKHGIYADGDALDRHLAADDLKRLRQVLQKYDIPFEQVRHLKPWVVTNMLLGLDLERHGYQRQHAVEFFLLQHAQAKTVQELESADYQMALFDGMSETEQEQYLRENLAELDDGASFRKTRALIDAWAAANGEAMEGLWRDSLAEKTLTAQFTQKVLLDKRNPEMADKIETLLKKDEAAFVGVGLLHLIGENGVPALLKRRGYEVEKLY